MRLALRRVVAAALGTALCAAAVAAEPSTAQAASGCQYDCVNLPYVPTSPTAAHVAFTTSTLTHTVVVVSNPDGSKPVSYDQQDGYYWSTDYDIVAPLAAQGTEYRYDVWATDTSGHSWHERGYFFSLIRTATVSFSKLHMIDDSDAFSPGDVMGAARCTPSAQDWSALSPLATDGDHELQVASNTDLGLTATVVCAKVPPTIGVDTTVADDDRIGLPYEISWYPGDYYAGTGTNCCVDWASTHTDVSDPIPDFATGVTLPIPFSQTTPYYADKGDDPGSPARLRYTVTGAVTFSDLHPAGSLPFATGGPVDPGLKVTAKPSSLDVAWNPNAFYGGYPVNDVRLDYRPTGQQVWTTLYFQPYVTSFSITGLLNDRSYEVQVSGVYAPGWPSFGLASTIATPQGLPTAISGWSTASTVLPYGSVVSSTVTVTSGGTPRVLVLQKKPYGASAWTNQAFVATDAGGKATLTMPVYAGTVSWRVGAPTTSTYELAISAPRSITSATTVAGFSTTTTYLKTGVALSDGVVVTPGAGRTVYVQCRKSGTTTWSTYASRVAASNGAVTVPMVAKAGWYQWRAYVPASPTRGAAAYTAVRSIHGA